MMNWIDGLVTAPSCRMGVPQPSVAQAVGVCRLADALVAWRDIGSSLKI